MTLPSIDQTEPTIPPGRSADASLKKFESLFDLLCGLAASYPGDPERVARGSLAAAGCRFDTLRDSLVGPLSLPPDEKLRALKRIAGNRDALQAGRPVLESTAADTAGWGVVQFISLDHTYRQNFKTRSKERVIEVRARAMTGPLGPDVFTQVMSPGLLRHIAKEIGFTRSRGKRPMEDDRELSGLRALAWFAPADGKSKMHKFSLPGPLREWNVGILTDRQRQNPARFVCPLDRPGDLPCWKCPAGRTQCRVACRPRTLEQRACPTCKGPDWLDPTKPIDTECLTCQAKGD